MKLSELKETIRTVIRERSINAISKLQQKNIEDVQKALDLYKKVKSKGDDKQVKKYVDVLKKLGKEKEKLAKELDMKVSGMYKDAEYKGESVNESLTIGKMAKRYKNKDNFISAFFKHMKKNYGDSFKDFEKDKKYRETIGKAWDREHGVKESVNESYDSKTGLFYLQGVPFTRERMKEIIGMMMKGSSKPNSKQFEYENQVVVKDKSSNKKVVIDSKNLNKIIVFYRKNSAKLASDKDF